MFKAFAEALVVNYFPLPKKFYYVAYIWIITKIQNVVISFSCFLFCSHIFVEVCNRVAGGLERCRIEWIARCINRVNTDSVVDKIRGESALFNFAHGKIFGKLMNYAADHFHVAQFFSANRSIKWCIYA